MRRSVGMRKSVSGRKRSSAALQKKKQPKSVSTKSDSVDGAPTIPVSMANSLANIRLVSLAVSVAVAQPGYPRRLRKAAASKSSSVNWHWPKSENNNIRANDKACSLRAVVSLSLAAKTVNFRLPLALSLATISPRWNRNDECFVENG
jgi:hypothetical protein